ncbi:hypothetical protein A4A49_09282 [Nicotiana attenuata]|uniref:Uncharacterized protein n=1 Tax=Nicotiana attenuata TaxID=49451 RepID=A0A1J6IET3_NICAT|nr:hypothetical protein A4A49_09282 [Nicotiana attenuata]
MERHHKKHPLDTSLNNQKLKFEPPGAWEFNLVKDLQQIPNIRAQEKSGTVTSISFFPDKIGCCKCLNTA